MSDWDVNSYRSEFESQEHWELRKNFMLANKDKLSEEEVVCMAQAFINIELLGCKYPEETMQRVAELAKGVAEEYREKRKTCLKRTFVAASAAAVAKVKGQIPQVESSQKEVSENKIKGNFVETMGFSDFSRCIWDDFKISCPNNSHTEEKQKEKGYKTCHNIWVKAVDDRLSRSDFSHNLNPVIAKTLKQRNPGFVFFLYDEHPVVLLERNAYINRGTLRWQFRGENICFVYYNDVFLGTGRKTLIAKAIENAAGQAIKNLQSIFYTVKVRKHVRCLNKITPSALASQNDELRVRSGIGEQIMKLMGWEGGGLGANQQGIIHPIILQPNIGRQGLGLNLNKKQNLAFKKNAFSLIRKWKQCNTEEDLVFSSEFTDAQRQILHNAAINLHLKAKSYGKRPDRYVVVFKNLVPWAIVRRLLRNGCKTNRYELFIPPRTIY